MVLNYAPIALSHSSAISKHVKVQKRPAHESIPVMSILSTILISPILSPSARTFPARSLVHSKYIAEENESRESTYQRTPAQVATLIRLHFFVVETSSLAKEVLRLLLSWSRKDVRGRYLIEVHSAKRALSITLPSLTCLLVYEGTLSEGVRATCCVDSQATRR
jgi:hypothetical protein